jgi:gluconate kinase
MPGYLVLVSRVITESAATYVEADNIHAAKVEALRKAKEVALIWEPSNLNDSDAAPWVDAIDEVHPH